MNRNVYILLCVQFLTAFADYAVLFTAISLVMHNSQSWYISALQAGFLVAFVVLAPWVGPFADSRPKAVVLFSANAVKAFGTILMFLGVDPLLSYAIVGVGAAMYAPAKYGILPELVSHDTLVKTNGLIEGITILATLSGSVIGGALADHSVKLALGLIGVFFLLSAITASFIERTLPFREKQKSESPLLHFLHLARNLLHTRRARFCILGVALFWAAAAALRVILVAWAPVVLNIHDSEGIAELTLSIAVGIIFGAIMAPRLIPLGHLRRARFAAYGVGAAILLLQISTGVWEARSVLFLVGLAGGLFVVPINAAIQEIGHHSIGSGNTIAVQQFFESLGMAGATMLYGLAAAWGADSVISIGVLSIAVMAAAILVSWRLPNANH